MVTTPPIDIHPCVPFLLKKSIMYFGLKARKTLMSYLNKLWIPIPPISKNHASMMVANEDFTLSVPNLWTENNTISIPIETPTIVSWSASAWFMSVNVVNIYMYFSGTESDFISSEREIQGQKFRGDKITCLTVNKWISVFMFSEEEGTEMEVTFTNVLDSSNCWKDCKEYNEFNLLLR